MASPNRPPPAAAKARGARKVGKFKGRNNNKDVKREEGSRFLMKLKLLLSCMALGFKAEGSSSCNTKHDDDRIRDLAVASVSSSNSVTGNSRSPPPNIAREMKYYYSHLIQFTFHELRLATRNFKPEYFLGEGGFGAVFKGWISHNGSSPSRPGMGIPVAVKTLNKEGNQGHKEWVAEVNHLGALQHPNLVKLVGYCIEDEKRLLVYEFMPRGSLEHHLFKRGSLPLPWSIRIKIMLGAARGLAFLHEEAKKPLIYRDLKTSNILLDLDYNAKLSDFGLARDAPVGDMTHVSTRVMGTQGYAAPEYVLTGHLTSKSDVYSFGVVLLEVLTGRRAMEKKRPAKEQNLVEWAKPYLNKGGGLYQLMDPRLEGQYTGRAAYKAMKLAAYCICRDQKQRPLMSEVVDGLRTLPDYNDMLCSPLSLQGMRVGPSSSSHGTKKRGRTRKVGSSSASSSRSTPTRFQASPLRFTPPILSPKTSVGQP